MSVIEEEIIDRYIRAGGIYAQAAKEVRDEIAEEEARERIDREEIEEIAEEDKEQ